MPLRRSVFPCLVLLAIAATAWAFTVAELQTRADDMESSYATLYAQASACTGGTCQGRAAIESAFASLEAQRAQLHADRDTITNCTQCGELDAALAEFDAAADDVSSIIETWEGTG